MDNRERRCGLCGHVNPPASEFCAECGILLASVPSGALSRARQTQFTLPDYLLAAREREREERRRRLAESGEGVGLLWTGAIAAVLALWFGGGSGIAAPVFAFGLLGVLVGLWRLRRDTRNLARAGTATVIVGSVVLGAALAQTLGFAGTRLPAPRPALVEPTPTPDPAEEPGAALANTATIPMFRGNAARTGEQPGPAPLTRPVVRWKSFVGGETYASPLIRDDLVYVATKAGSLVALTMRDGQEAWRADVGDYVARSTPALGADTLFVSAGYALLAIDAATGEERWSVPLRFAGSCSPVVSGHLVYAATQEGHVTAFATETGEEIWHYRNDHLLFGSPAVADGVVVIADEGGIVTAIAADSGRELWQEPAGGEVFATPAIVNGTVHIATSEPALVAFDLQTGAERWRRAAGGESSPAATREWVFLGGDDQSLRAFERETGAPRWSSPLGYEIRSSATVADGAVFIGSGPTLNAIAQEDGRTLWTYVTGGDITSDLAVAGGIVVATSHDGYVYALGLPRPAGTALADQDLTAGARGVSLGASR
jgi:outer membrane protein assembly factor BamB